MTVRGGIYNYSCSAVQRARAGECVERVLVFATKGVQKPTFRRHEWRLPCEMLSTVWLPVRHRGTKARYVTWYTSELSSSFFTTLLSDAPDGPHRTSAPWQSSR